jgi:acetyltransferase-like isoleucine patch superfamily enzyme
VSEVRRIAVVLVGGVGPATPGPVPATPGPVLATPGPVLAGRSAGGWLLAEIEQLDPAVVTAVGPAADVAGLATAASRLPGLACRWTQQLPDPAELPVLLVPTTVPLIGAGTLARAADAATTAGKAARRSARRDARRAVLLRPRHQTPWWDPAPAAAPEAFCGMAVSGAVQLSIGELAELVGGALCDTEVRHRLSTAGVTIEELPVHPVESLRSTDPVELAQARRAVQARIVNGWLRRGVHVEDPATTYIDATVELATGVVLLPGSHLAGATSVGAGSRIGPQVLLRDSRVGSDCHIRYAVCQDVDLGDRVNVGPYAWLRSGARLGEDCRAGAFVEIADSSVGAGSSVPHLAGLFSADVGRDCNLASMTGPANFNGGVKNRVRIGDGVSIGAGTILVAPVEVGAGAETAAGSVITDDVPSGALGMARTAQRNIAGWRELRRAVRDTTG